MFHLWTQVFNQVEFSDRQRLMTLIMISATELANSIVHSGHSYAMGHAASSLSAIAKLREVYSGVTQVSCCKNLTLNWSVSQLPQNYLITHILPMSKSDINE